MMPAMPFCVVLSLSSHVSSCCCSRCQVVMNIDGRPAQTHHLTQTHTGVQRQNQKTRRKAKQEFYFLSCAHTVSAETRDGGEGGEKGCLQLSKCILVTKVKGQHLALGIM